MQCTNNIARAALGIQRATLVRVGLDGHSQPIIEQRASCGCSWTRDGHARLHVCVVAIRGECTSEPWLDPDVRFALRGNGIDYGITHEGTLLGYVRRTRPGTWVAWEAGYRMDERGIARGEGSSRIRATALLLRNLAR